MSEDKRRAERDRPSTEGGNHVDPEQARCFPCLDTLLGWQHVIQMIRHLSFEPHPYLLGKKKLVTHFVFGFVFNEIYQT